MFSVVRFTVFELVLVAVFAAFIGVLGVVPPIFLGGLGVPVTLQTFGVMCVGGLLRPRLAVCSVLVVVVLALFGLPILSGGRGGVGVLFGPTGGFLLGWVPGVLVVSGLCGFLVLRFRRFWVRWLTVFVSCFVGGVLVVYVFGLPWVVGVSGVSLDVAVWGVLVFLPGDLLKAGFAAFLVLYMRDNYGFLLQEEGR